MQPSVPQAPESGLPPVPGPAPLSSSNPSAPLAPEAPIAPAAVPGATTPAMADDGDLIEKEWVQQVKRIVTATAHDPFEQSRQFTKLKADYMQKRYGKRIESED